MKVYKYTPHVIEFIKNSMLKVTPIQQLNDPFENKYTDNAIQSLDVRYGGNSSIVKKAIEPSRGDQQDVGVISLSKCAKSIPMLSYYANNFKGGILEFEISEKTPKHFFNNNSLDFL
jgi:hypothetical protein